MFGKLLREPLLHFLLLGAALFVGYQVLNPEPAAEPDRIVVTAQDIAGLEQSFQTTWRRAPTDKERGAMIDGFIRQEVLVREAEALGLDRNDTVIRQRLQQKMTFLLSSGANALEPSDEDLQTYLAANPDRYRISGRVGFDQVYLGQSTTQAEIDAALAALNGGADPHSVGRQTLLPLSTPLSPAVAIDSAFGSGFAGTIEALPVGDWSGPVRSGFGYHLIRITGSAPASLPALDSIRDKVEAGWRDARAEELTESIYQELQARFTIEIEEAGT